MMVTPDSEAISWLRVLMAAVIVLGLLGIMGVILKYIGMRGLRMPGTGMQLRRLQILETLALDIKRRLIIVRCDGKEHLLLLGINQDIVVESNLKSQPKVIPENESAT